MAEPPATETLYVSDLPLNVDDKQIQAIFGAYGTIKSCSSFTSLGKKSARITFADVEEATWIRENLDGNIPEGLDSAVGVRYHSMSIVGNGEKGASWKGGGKASTNTSNRWEPYGGKDNGGKGSNKGSMAGTGDSIQTLKKGLRQANALPGGKWSNDDNALFIGNLPEDTSDVDLYEIFAPFGAIPTKGVRAMLNPEGKCTGIGFVNFLDEKAAQMAISTLNGTMLPSGNTLKISVKRPGKPRDGP